MNKLRSHNGHFTQDITSHTTLGKSKILFSITLLQLFLKRLSILSFS